MNKDTNEIKAAIATLKASDALAKFKADDDAVLAALELAAVSDDEISDAHLDEDDAEALLGGAAMRLERKLDVRAGWEIWLVPNGELTGFAEGYTSGCTRWGSASQFDSLAEVDARFAELAEENFRREGGEHDRVFDANCADYDDDAARSKAFAAADAACKEYVARCVEGHSIEWQDDLKWVRVRKVEIDGNEDIEFAGAL